MGHDAEVIVVGGGLAGSATALAFAVRGHEVLLLDRTAFPRPKVCGEGLFPHGVAALEALGISPPAGSRPFRGVRFTAGDAHAAGRFPDGGLGLGVRRAELDASLYAAACAHPSIRVLERTGARGLGPDGVVRTTSGAVRGRLVVGADGLHSQVRGWAGLEGRRRGRKRYGVRGHWQLPAGAPDPEWVDVHVVGGGELYVTPVAPGVVNLAALCEHATMQRFKGDLARGMDGFLAQSPALAALLDGAEALDRVQACGPLRQQARDVVADGLLLVGDAAGFLDGITGEGMSISLASAHLAADVGSRALRGGSVRRDRLRAYARGRAALVRDVERLGKTVLWGIRWPWLVRGALAVLARRPALFDRLLAVETGRASLWSLALP